MTTKKLISTATLAFLLTAGVASAQVADPTTTGTGVTDATASTLGTTTAPGTPNTGAGGDTAENMLLLGSSALAALVGMAYLVSRKSLVR